MATCSRILINVLLGLVLVIILAVIGVLIYVWVSCPSLMRCGFNLILGRGLTGGKTVSDKDYLASMSGIGRGKNVLMSRSSTFDSGLWAPGPTSGENSDPKDLFERTKNLPEEAKNVGENSKVAQEPAEGPVPMTTKKSGAFGRMGSTYNEW